MVLVVQLIISSSNHRFHHASIAFCRAKISTSTKSVRFDCLLLSFFCSSVFSRMKSDEIWASMTTWTARRTRCSHSSKNEVFNTARSATNFALCASNSHFGTCATSRHLWLRLCVATDLRWIWIVEGNKNSDNQDLTSIAEMDLWSQALQSWTGVIKDIAGLGDPNSQMLRLV